MGISAKACQISELPAHRPSVFGEAPGRAPTSSLTVNDSRHSGSQVDQVIDGEWHAIWTRSRHEPAVCGNLTAKGIETFFPTFIRLSRWSDRTKRIAAPLFPGYCFARFAPSALSKVVQANGVVSVLCNAGQPIPVPRSEIEALQQTVASGLALAPCSNLEPGSPVRVVSGPLAGVTGRLVRRGADNLLILAVELLNSGASVRVSAWDVAAL